MEAIYIALVTTASSHFSEDFHMTGNFDLVPAKEGALQQVWAAV